MRLSLVKLVIFSVLACWTIGIIALALYVRSQAWTEDRVRRDGVFLVHEILEKTPEASRAERLSVLQEHFSVGLALISRNDLERRIGRPGAPGEKIAYRMSARRAWYFIVFEDGSGALAAGPVNPALPTGVVPIGLLLALILLPIIAAAIAFRLGRGLLKVERATQALAVGDLSARVENHNGSSNELVASFNAMAERVEVLVRNRDELIQAVSHELGSPLSRLRFHIELLDNLSDTKRTERIQAMAGELDTLDHLVAELLNYAQSDELELDSRTFSPHQGIEDLAELISSVVPDPRLLEVTLRLQPDVLIFADQVLFLRTVSNLLSNAIQHANGEVLLELLQETDRVRVVVHDDGPGIPEAFREKVTTPFFRLQADRGRKTGGVGLGLAIVARIIQRHSGQLLIGTSPLGGTMVSTVWPRAIR